MSEIYNSPILQDQNYIDRIDNPEDNFSEMKLYIQNVESKSNTLQKENENLQKAISILEKEKSNLANNLEQKDISLSELSQILENYKRKENNYENKIKELEKVNQELNYNIIQLNQKNKSLNSSLETFLKSPNLNNEKNNNTQILQLNEKLDETEITKQKIEFENKMLKNKINDIQNQYENEIKLITNLKNGEILQLQKTISSLNNNLNSNLRKNSYEISKNNNYNNNGNYSQILIDQVSSLENKIRVLNEENFNLKKENKLLLSQIMDLNISNEHKDKYIEELQKKISE